MWSRRSWRAALLCLLALAVVVVPASFSSFSQAVQVINANENAHTLVLALPGPFNGCTYLDQGANQTTDSILDLIRPSAFLTLANGTLSGEGGPIASAELTSLSPETVRYSIAPGYTWSDGVAFSASDLVQWWQEARGLASVVSDGYRAIRSLSVSGDGSVVTAVFSKPYADWNLLFRDVEQRGAGDGCAISNLETRATLGPYLVSSATKSRVVLVMNTAWTADPNRFGRIVIDASTKLPTNQQEIYASYSHSVTRSDVELISENPALTSRIASSNDIEQMTFAPNSPLIDSLVVRQALSRSISRQLMIDQVFGSVTFSPSVAASAIFSQGQSQYPGGIGSNPTGQSQNAGSDPSSDVLNDCESCAVAALRGIGYVKTSSGWLSPSGKYLSVRLGVGPSDLDHRVAAIIKSDWASFGVPTQVVKEKSATMAARAAASNNVDAAIFSRPTTTAPSYTARSWSGPAYADTYPSGVRLASLNALFTKASAIFNPVTAAATWLQFDQVIMNDFWVRPLFTSPSLSVWSSNLATVQSSFTVAGFVDQVLTWSIVPATPSS